MGPLIAVTGSTGFIGSSIIKACINAGYRVRVLTRNQVSHALIDDVETHTGDLLTTDDWSAFVFGVDIIIHTAAELSNPDTMEAINFLAPKKMSEAADLAGVKLWIQLSSVGVYGNVKAGLVNENNVENPQNLYEITKWRFDDWLKNTRNRRKMFFCILRPSNVYGPEMLNQSLYRLMKNIKNRRFVFLGNSGASANYVHVEDLVKAIMLCMTNPIVYNNTYIVSVWAPIESMIAGLSEGLKANKPILRIPEFLARFLATVLKSFPEWPLTDSRIDALTKRVRYDTAKIEDQLGWSASITIETGMRMLAEEFINEA